MLVQSLFYLFAGICTLAAFLTITRKNAVLSAVWLIICLCSLAAIYVLLQAFFVAAVQVIVYAGAVLMLFVFVIMMLNLRQGIIGTMRNVGLKFIGLGIAALVLYQLRLAIKGTGLLNVVQTGVEMRFGEASALGQLLFTKYVYPFEVTSILLLVAIVGALVLAGKEAGR